MFDIAYQVELSIEIYRKQQDSCMDFVFSESPKSRLARAIAESFDYMRAYNLWKYASILFSTHGGL